MSEQKQKTDILLKALDERYKGTAPNQPQII